MRNTAEMKSMLLAKDPTYTQQELDGMTAEQVRNAYQDLVETLNCDPENWAWRREHAIAGNL